MRIQKLKTSNLLVVIFHKILSIFLKFVASIEIILEEIGFFSCFGGGDAEFGCRYGSLICQPLA